MHEWAIARFFKTVSVLIPLLPAIAAASGPRLEIPEPNGRVSIWAVAPNVLRIDFVPRGVLPTPTPILLERGLRAARPIGSLQGSTLKTAELTATSDANRLQVNGLAVDLAALATGVVRLHHPADDHLYGMRGYPIRPSNDPKLNPAQGLFRDSGAPVKAGSQGDGGAPIAFTNKWGVFIDSVDGEFFNQDGTLEFKNGSRKGVEAYLVVGPPEQFMSVVADLTGHPPMPPKWTLGFLNSQWGSDEATISSIVDEYRERQIPFDCFILDFDYKAWGEDDYGEFRWNSTSGAGNVGPDKFPDGTSGKFAANMLSKGVHLVGIMKPRVLVVNTLGQPTEAAKDGTPNHWFLPGEKPYEDYFSHRLALDIDFSQPGARAWYWQHAKGLFDAGLAGWWNDEADDNFPSLGFFQMQQSLTEGQRSVSNQRVWSLNRNFYLGAQRWGFATWSGDIRTGFPSMSAQPLRMLATLDIGQPSWTMDGGGFGGHPSPENYARWMEFAAVCPIMRVHGTYGQRRQPWVYGPIAEAAAKHAIELRYQLKPYLYSLTREATETGIGLVRPLFWEFPDDSGSANVTDSWMLGPALLAAPVLKQGQTTRTVYLPPGKWFDYKNGQSYDGGRSVDVSVDPDSWMDLPLFARAGSIVATQPVEQYTSQTPQPEMTLDVWPSSDRVAKFRAYDDDGSTYAYEHGHYSSQEIEASPKRDGVEIRFGKPQGSWHSALRQYRLRVHLGDRLAEITFPAQKEGTAFAAAQP
jgi:alpha-glucosidase